MSGFATMIALALVTSEPADEGARPSVQNRFASKYNTFSVAVTGVTHIRSDYYSSFGGGLDLGYYPTESLGLEVRGVLLHTRLDGAARRVKKETGLTPDAQPQRAMLALGARYSVGYGKVMMADRFVLHFDPQAVVYLGAATTDTRVLPTALAGLSLLTHYRWGVQAKIDLMMSIQLEDRSRGWVPSIGFFPMLSVGWSTGPREDR